MNNNANNDIWLKILWESIENHILTSDQIIETVKENNAPYEVITQLINSKKHSLRLFFRTIHDIIHKYDEDGFYIKNGDEFDNVLSWEDPNEIDDENNNEEDE